MYQVLVEQGAICRLEKTFYARKESIETEVLKTSENTTRMFKKDRDRRGQEVVLARLHASEMVSLRACQDGFFTCGRYVELLNDASTKFGRDRVGVPRG